MLEMLDRHRVVYIPALRTRLSQDGMFTRFSVGAPSPSLPKRPFLGRFEAPHIRP